MISSFDTKIPVLPQGWEFKSLSDLFDFSGGYSATRSQLSNKGYCYLHYGDIHTADKSFINVSEDFEDIPKLNIDLENINPNYLLKDGDVVFVDASEDYEGVTKHLVISNKNNIPFISGLHTIVAKKKTNQLQKDYLRYCFQTEFVRKQFLFYAAGAKVSGISKSNIRKIVLLFPNCVSEQERIASVLIDIDSLLNNLNKLILKKKKIKQGIIYQLLTSQIRLKKYTDDWVIKKVEEIGQVGRGRVISNIEISKSLNPKYPVFSSQTSNKGIMGYIDSYDFDGDYVTWTTDGANAGTTFARTGRFNCTNVCGTIKLYDSNHVFIAELLDIINPQHVSIHLGNPKLMNDIMKKIEIKIPSLRNEQNDIANIILDLDKELDILETKRKKILNLKKSVMQEILTGKTRLIKTEINNARKIKT